MRLTQFAREHTEMAFQLVRAKYRREREAVPALPPLPAELDFSGFVENGLGIAALEGGELRGFLCCWGPFPNAFGSTKVQGVFSPLHGNAATEEGAGDTYARLYQAAARRWVGAGAVSHGICLGAHDFTARERFFRYGFGLRCIDAVRPMEPTGPQRCPGAVFSELPWERRSDIRPLYRGLVEHLEESPSFLRYPGRALGENEERGGCRFFIAQKDGDTVAYLRVGREGENFACAAPDMWNISGAFCLPAHRGTGVFQALLDMVIGTLKEEGCHRLGVDYESFNPTASGFWGKHFTPYTYGLVRRIDENILERE